METQTGQTARRQPITADFADDPNLDAAVSAILQDAKDGSIADLGIVDQEFFLGALDEGSEFLRAFTGLTRNFGCPAT